MYTREQLTIYPYFQERLKQRRISDVLDPLTGIIARRDMIAFVQDLIARQIPFTFGMMDLDNFKYINDTYGHSVGDGVLERLAADICAYIGDSGIVGRFGGDEFLFVNFRDIEYDDKKKFCLGLYSDFRVLRRSIKVNEFELFVTATTGLASFPSDADNYDDLFGLIDKTLYRGKSKGRNCYIIYLESKHKDIVIEELHKHSLYELFVGISENFDSTPDLYEKMKKVYQYIRHDLHLSNMYYIGKERIIRSVEDRREIGPALDIDACVSEPVFTTNNIEDIRESCPVFYETMMKAGFETAMISKVNAGPRLFGYLMFAEPRSLRIWQDEERAILFSFARMITGYMMGRGIEF